MFLTTADLYRIDHGSLSFACKGERDLCLFSNMNDLWCLCVAAKVLNILGQLFRSVEQGQSLRIAKLHVR